MKAVITSDWHLRSTIPTCCSNTKLEWINIQRESVNQVVQLAIKENCDVFVVGDLFHKVTDISFECVNVVLSAAEELGKHNLKFYFIAGNHDLKYSSIENLEDSACGILAHSHSCILLNNNTFSNIGAASFSEKPEDKEIVFLHTLCMPEKSKPDYVDCETPISLANKFNNAKFIFLGDYHRSFIEKVKNKSNQDCIVVNPGCLTIQASDFQEYETEVCLVNTETEETEWFEIYHPDQKFVVSDKQMIQDDSIETFIKAIENNEGMTLDYISNLNKVIISENEQIQQKVRSWI